MIILFHPLDQAVLAAARAVDIRESLSYLLLFRISSVLTLGSPSLRTHAPRTVFCALTPWTLYVSPILPGSWRLW